MIHDNKSQLKTARAKQLYNAPVSREAIEINRTSSDPIAIEVDHGTIGDERPVSRQGDDYARAPARKNTACEGACFDWPVLAPDAGCVRLCADAAHSRMGMGVSPSQ